MQQECNAIEEEEAVPSPPVFDDDVEMEPTTEPAKEPTADQKGEDQPMEDKTDCFFISEEDLQNLNVTAIGKEIMKLEGEKEILQKQVNIGAIKEYFASLYS